MLSLVRIWKDPSLRDFPAVWREAAHHGLQGPALQGGPLSLPPGLLALLLGLPSSSLTASSSVLGRPEPQPQPCPPVLSALLLPGTPSAVRGPSSSLPWPGPWEPLWGRGSSASGISPAFGQQEVCPWRGEPCSWPQASYSARPKFRGGAWGLLLISTLQFRASGLRGPESTPRSGWGPVGGTGGW